MSVTKISQAGTLAMKSWETKNCRKKQNQKSSAILNDYLLLIFNNLNSIHAFDTTKLNVLYTSYLVT